MKYKKYLVFLFLIMILGCNKTYADSVNYYKYTKNNPIVYELNTYKIDTNLNENNLFNILAIDCNGLFGNKNDPKSLRYLIDEILQYPRIIVPIIVIVLGIVDLAKAVIASKEDEMKKAQTTFIKRVIIGVAFFLVPVFIDIIMWLADIVWNGMYPTCGL